MTGEITITIMDNLTADPKVRWIGDGTTVASFMIASALRAFDRSTNSWKDGETMFTRCSAWYEVGENIVESLKKGMRAIISRRLQRRSRETQQGERRTVIKMVIDEIGPPLRYAAAHTERNQRRDAGSDDRSGYGGAGYGGSSGSAGGNYANSSGGSGDRSSGGVPSQPRYGFGGNQGGLGGGQDGADDPWGSPTGGFGGDTS